MKSLLPSSRKLLPLYHAPCRFLRLEAISRHCTPLKRAEMTKKITDRQTGVGFCTHNRGAGRRCGRETDYKPDGISRFSVSSPLAVGRIEMFTEQMLSIRSVRCIENEGL